jgi:hypothetical protein
MKVKKLTKKNPESYLYNPVFLNEKIFKISNPKALQTYIEMNRTDFTLRDIENMWKEFKTNGEVWL